MKVADILGTKGSHVVTGNGDASVLTAAKLLSDSQVGVLVIVDHSGNVIDALLENPGPSWYFARQAREAARKWRFAPADESGSRGWLLRFEFTRGGTTAHATAQS